MNEYNNELCLNLDMLFRGIKSRYQWYREAIKGKAMLPNVPFIFFFPAWSLKNESNKGGACAFFNLETENKIKIGEGE